MQKTEFNTTVAADAIRRAMAVLKDMTPIYRDIAEYIVQATRKRFTLGEAPDGSKWAPKSEATIARYKKLGYGNLPKALIGPGRRLSREIKRYADRNGAVIGSSLVYSRVMQEGAAKGALGLTMRGKSMVPIPWGRIPARVWLGVSKQDELEIVGIVEEALEDQLQGKA